MRGFLEFEKVFKEHFKDNIYLFMNKDEWEYEDIGPCPFEYELQDNLDNISYDSYGSEDSDLRRIYYIKDFDIYVEFTGNRSSYQGEDWYSYKEVSKTTKTISVWT